MISIVIVLGVLVVLCIYEKNDFEYTLLVQTVVLLVQSFNTTTTAVVVVLLLPSYNSSVV